MFVIWVCLNVLLIRIFEFFAGVLVYLKDYLGVPRVTGQKEWLDSFFFFFFFFWISWVNLLNFLGRGPRIDIKGQNLKFCVNIYTKIYFFKNWDGAMLSSPALAFYHSLFELLTYSLSLSIPNEDKPSIYRLRTRLVHCNDYYMGIKISITRNTLSWNVISVTIH